MPSFDVVSEIDQHELTNAVDQANREISTRFDFKGANASFTLEKDEIALAASSEFSIKQMQDVLLNKLSKRNIDPRMLTYGTMESNLHEARIKAKIAQGISTELGKKIVKLMKDAKLKVQGSIQGDQVRVNGKQRDDLQNAIQFLKQQDLELPLQFTNFRD